jgi:hypothetical protein
MKRYISAVLINAMLFQFTGCYSPKYLSKDDINNYYTDETINITTKDKRVFVIKQEIKFSEVEAHPAIGFCKDYRMQDDTLLLFKYRIEYKNQKDENGNTFLQFAIDTVRIPENMIQKMSIDEYDSQSTWYLASAIISGVLILILYVAGSNFEDTY